MGRTGEGTINVTQRGVAPGGGLPRRLKAIAEVLASGRGVIVKESEQH